LNADLLATASIKERGTACNTPAAFAVEDGKPGHVQTYRGLVAPIRTTAGWRAYGPEKMNRVAEIVALRSLGFSLAQVGRVLKGDPCGMEPALAAHKTSLEGRICHLADTLGKVRELRDDLTRGQAPTTGDLAHLLVPLAEMRVAFELPWPWGGERFELRDVRSMNYIIGPLFSGKTRLAQRLAETLPGAVFIGLERLADGGAAARAKLNADPALGTRVVQAMDWLVEDGAVVSDPLTALVVEMEAEGPAILVIDTIEQGLDQATQEALVVHLRRRGSGARPLFCLTRSCAILDLAAVGPDEAIIFCPANHSPPIRVAPYPGAPGYEAVATCLASPEVRARTDGVIAHRPTVA
jgi:DNA-binding transcriptional MerR regulator